MELVAKGLDDIEDYEQKVKAGHVFTEEEVKEANDTTKKVQEMAARIKQKPNRATKKKRQPRKKRK